VTPLLELRGVTKLFALGGGRMLHAVDGVDLAVMPGESLGLVGESGSGKSTLARLAARLIDLTAGSVRFDGEEIGRLPPARFSRDPRRSAIQLVFQSADDALNPAFSAGRNIATGLGALRLTDDIRRSVRVVAAEVGLDEELLDRRPHQLSGGQKARVGIARALIREPRLLILDEPTAALDVSVQAIVLKLIDTLRRTRGIALIFVSHDLDVVKLMSDRVAVLYLGRVAEVGPVGEVLEQPCHPYTRALVAARPGRQRPQTLAGEPPSPVDTVAEQCPFHTRCPLAEAQCRSSRPPLRQLDTSVASIRGVACHVVAGVNGPAACSPR